MPDLVYQTSKRCWDLGSDEIRLCAVDLSGPAECIDSFRLLLTDEERERADRFLTENLRNRFILARGILRAALGRSFGIEPSAIEFSYNAHGKPFLKGDEHKHISFNLSHSNGRGLFAISQGRELGVDIERIRPLPDFDSIASHFFHTEEYHAFLTVPPEQRDAAFFNCWTRKEAYVKAVGMGLSVPLNSFRVSVLPNEPVTLIAGEDCSWVLSDISPDCDYAAALVSKGESEMINAWRFNDASECATYFRV